ncbi:hypothetical protein [Bordetella genomosp. 4]|nr:hypothetical protein [Bordetella genomosp. 4]
MKELFSSDLQSVSGGSTPNIATMRALGAISSTVGYMLAVQIKRRVGLNTSGTIEGITGANAIGGFVSHSMWDDQNLPIEDRSAAGLATSFVCGASVGLFEDMAKAAISNVRQKS